MTNGRIIVFLVLCLSLVDSHDEISALGPQLLDPKAAQEYAADSEKAAAGDPDAAYRVGEALESGRLGGMKDLNKALTFYRQAAKKGHQQAAARVNQLEAKLGLSQPKPESR
jgi:TPR repeat protein